VVAAILAIDIAEPMLFLSILLLPCIPAAIARLLNAADATGFNAAAYLL
jgi:hypothetical protein